MRHSAAELLGRIRVAQVIESDGPGGAERVLAELSGSLHRAGLAVVGVLPLTGEGWLARELEHVGIQVERVPMNGPLDLASIAALTRVFRRHSITAVHSHDFQMAVACAAASWRVGAAHVMTMHGSRYYAERWRRRAALGLAVRAPRSALVAVSHALATHLRRDLRLSAGKVSVVANGVPLRGPAVPARLRADLRLKRDDQLVLAVGNLYPVKGHRDLIDALSLLDAGDRRVHLAIAGRGDLAEALTSHACDLGMSDRVHLLGLRADIPELLAAADLFVMPSHSEGLPMAVLEAMAAGLPIVATAVGDVPRALDHGSAGLLVPPASPTVLAAAMRLLLDDRRLARTLGERAAVRVRAHYSLQAMADRYASLYASLRAEPVSAAPAAARAASPARSTANASEALSDRAPAASRRASDSSRRGAGVPAAARPA